MRENAPKYVLSAEHIRKFQNATPPRFKTKPQEKEESSKRYSTEITVPRTPKLRSRYRTRSVQAIGFAEKEEKELKEIQK